MIYTKIPKVFDINIDTFELELEYYLNNLPDAEAKRLEQYNKSSLCKMYHNYIYRSYEASINLNDPERQYSIQCIDIHTPEENYDKHKSILRKSFDLNSYDYSEFNFFEKTIATAKQNPLISNIILLDMKPGAGIYRHIHSNQNEYIIHTLLEDTDPGYLEVYSTQSEAPAANEIVRISKKGDQFMHKAILPHGGHVPTNSKTARVLSVSIQIEDESQLL